MPQTGQNSRGQPITSASREEKASAPTAVIRRVRRRSRYAWARQAWEQ
ncbi:hypothetical protein ACI1MP_37980 (plasmid) [Kitasatospora griseola]